MVFSLMILPWREELFLKQTKMHIRKSFSQRILLTILVLVLFLTWFPPVTVNAINQPFSEQYEPAAQLSMLTTEEKVGQLFLIEFNGNDTSEISSIYNLIVNYHVGGVVLNRDNDNFINPESLPVDCWNLVNRLQHLEFDFSLEGSQDSLPPNSQDSEFIPLFIGLSQEGNQSEYSEILSGLSPIPSQMSVGATWDIKLAEQVGLQVGKELSVLGVNMLLGPSLDVISSQSPSQSDLGVRSFGGDPYWVGKFGQAYIRGVHQGSSNQIAVVGKYFPGLGSSDRLPEDEVATIRKSLDQLKQIDLAPFFAVTGNALSPDSTVDALLNSHIRYQGLQGNIRSTTRPISLDPQSLDLLMNLDPLSSWRSSGGVLISDNLGSQAIQQLYDPSGESFDITKVAVDAFIAGNDILYLGNYGIGYKPISDFEIIQALDFFAQKYNEDQDFASRVDESVLRILSLKNSLYPNFNPSNILVSQLNLSSLGKGDIAEIVARQSATLINPNLTELDAALPSSPSNSDRLVILTDTEFEKSCEDCPYIATLGTTSLEDTIIRLYGPLSGGHLVRANLTSYSFKEVITLLDFPSDVEHMAIDLYNANWIIIASLDIDENRPYSHAIIRLLAERQDLLRDKNIVVLAFGAPYYLDATNISKITALFSFYSKLTSSQEVAAKILFKEFPAITGNLPVSVPGINYDLISATSPDPTRDFSIFLDAEAEIVSTQESNGTTPQAPLYHVEDIINLRTSIILDHNGNQVPDGTPVSFIITSQGESTNLPQVTTLDGSATTNYLIETGNNFTIMAESSLAKSNEIEISVLGDSSVISSSGTAASESNGTGQPSPGSETASSENLDPSSPESIEPVSSWDLWLISLIIVTTVSLTAYQVGALSGLVRWGLRWGFSALISGLLVYNYIMLELPGVSLIFKENVTNLSLGLAVLAGSLLGWLFSFIYQRVFSQ